MTLYITPSGRIYRRGSWTRPVREEAQAEASNVYVPINVKVENDDYVITALVPGVKADDLSVQVQNEVLTIQGEINDQDSEKEQFLLRELPAGRFYRTIHLPEQLDSSKAVADLNEGVLTLRLPKLEEARPKTIKVSVN